MSSKAMHRADGRVDSIVALTAGSLILLGAAAAGIASGQFALPVVFGIVGAVILGFGIYLHRRRGTVPDMPLRQWAELGVAAAPGLVTGMILLFAPKMDTWVSAAMVVVGAVFGVLSSRMASLLFRK